VLRPARLGVFPEKSQFVPMTPDVCTPYLSGGSREDADTHDGSKQFPNLNRVTIKRARHSPSSPILDKSLSDSEGEMT